MYVWTHRIVSGKLNLNHGKQRVFCGHAPKRNFQDAAVIFIIQERVSRRFWRMISNCLHHELKTTVRIVRLLIAELGHKV